MTTTQLAIIGAGPGGYVAAFHAADLGLSVTLIDKQANPGGVCLYRGCIPSKAILHAAKVISDAKEAKAFGVTFDEPQIDIDKLRAWKNTIVSRLTGGLGQLNKQRKITYVQGSAKFLNSKTLEITKTDGSIEALAFENAILATGSRPVTLPFLPASPRVWDSTAALALSDIPRSLLVIGGGYIGLELGCAYQALGSQVSVVEALPQLLNGADRDLADILSRRIKKTFTQVLLNTKILKAVASGTGITATFENAKGEASETTYDNILVSVGRKPNTEGLGLEKTQIKTDKNGFVTVDPQRRTAEPNIFAIGDVAGQPMLAHKASYEAKIAAEVIAGQQTIYDPKAIPAVVFTDPELAWVGLTETAAKEQGLDVTVFKFPWAASGRAMTLGRTDGSTKIIADTQSKRILGVGIVGVNAGDLISEAALAIEMGAVADDMAWTIHPHPTLSEMLMETAEGLFGHCTHLKK